MKIIHSLITISLLGSVALAAPISTQSGFSGLVAGGITSLSYKNNMVAGTKSDNKLSDKRINNLSDSADKKSSIQPSFNFDIRYTFAQAQTEIFAKSILGDILTFDSLAKIGARTHFDALGTIGLAALVSTGPTQVWRDPYAVGVNRDTADMSSMGIALKFENIVDTGFSAEVKMRKFNIDGDDESALGTGFNDVLNREGDLKEAIVSYQWDINAQHHLITALKYSDYDLDGKAMEHKETGLGINYMYFSQKWNFFATAGIAKSDYDHTNPLFNKQADATVLSGSLTAMYNNPFEISEDLALTATIATKESNSDINFYDSSIALMNIGLLYKF